MLTLKVYKNNKSENQNGHPAAQLENTSRIAKLDELDGVR